MKHDSYPQILFETEEDFSKFLSENSASGVWMKIAKKDSGVKSINYDQALEVALCYGWIDGQVNKLDGKFYLQKFTPRGPKSIWSQRNVGIAERLIKEGKMRKAGLLKIEEAKKDGRWENAYGGSKDLVIPEDFIKEVKKDKNVYAFYLTLNKSNLFAIYYRLHSAKRPETRERRMKMILEMMSKGEKLY